MPEENQSLIPVPTEENQPSIPTDDSNGEKKLDSILDAVKELTKITGNLVKEWEKWRKAGKFIVSFTLTGYLLSAMLLA